MKVTTLRLVGASIVVWFDGATTVSDLIGRVRRWPVTVWDRHLLQRPQPKSLAAAGETPS